MANALEKEFYTVLRLIKKRSLEKIEVILKERNYRVSRNIPSVLDMCYNKFANRLVAQDISDLVATKEFGESYIDIVINLRERMLSAFSSDWELYVDIPFRDYRKDELLSEIRKSPKYRTWRYACLDRDFGKCQNNKCGIDTSKAYSLGVKLDIHHLNPLRRIIDRNNVQSLEDAEKCDEIWDRNGITYCDICHREITNFERLLQTWTSLSQTVMFPQRAKFRIC